MASYNDRMLERCPPVLHPGEKEHVLVMQDESIFHMNESWWCVWLGQDQQPIQVKGNGRVIHVSDFIAETISRIKLSNEQIADQVKLPEEHHLPVFEARKITYSGKGFNTWWDLPQLIKQVKTAIDVFNYTHLDCVAVFMFDRSSAHEGFTENALNVNSMNINPAGKQRKLRDIHIPCSNPDPAPGEEDTCSWVQQMTFPNDHPEERLQGQAKGIRVVLQEWKSVWAKFTSICEQCGTRPVGKCILCTKSQTRKDAERRIAFVEATGEEDATSAEDVNLANADPPSTDDDKWCCMYRILSLQEDF
jgi:hypothetical protein